MTYVVVGKYVVAHCILPSDAQHFWAAQPSKEQKCRFALVKSDWFHAKRK